MYYYKDTNYYYKDTNYYYKDTNYYYKYLYITVMYICYLG